MNIKGRYVIVGFAAASFLFFWLPRYAADYLLARYAMLGFAVFFVLALIFLIPIRYNEIAELHRLGLGEATVQRWQLIGELLGIAAAAALVAVFWSIGVKIDQENRTARAKYFLKAAIKVEEYCNVQNLSESECIWKGRMLDAFPEYVYGEISSGTTSSLERDLAARITHSRGNTENTQSLRMALTNLGRLDVQNPVASFIMEILSASAAALLLISLPVRVASSLYQADKGRGLLGWAEVYAVLFGVLRRGK